MFKPYIEIIETLVELSREKAYEQLLLTTEWRGFREGLLKRDRYRCFSCQKNDGIYRQDRVELNPFDMLARNKAIDKWVEMFLNISRCESKNLNKAFNEKEERIRLLGLAQLSHANYKFERIVLQIHHTYYIYENLPWEYPNESLQSLCMLCHQHVHREKQIPVYFDNSLKEIYGYHRNCGRCGGTGHLREYEHVQHGVCFECGGSGGTVQRT